MIKYRLIAFDMDGTLVKRPSSWEKIHKYFGTEDIEKRNWELYSNGLIDYQEFMRRDIKAWGKVSRDKITQILLDYQFMDGALALAEYLREKPVYKVIITSGIDILAQDVAKKLKFNDYYANGLEFDDDGYLTGEGIVRVEPFCKDKVLNRLMLKMDVAKDQVISVGDSYYDIGLFNTSGLSIGIDNKDLHSVNVNYIVKDLYELLELLKTLFDEQ